MSSLLPELEMCRDCGAAHRNPAVCPSDCEHTNREIDEPHMSVEWCLDCGYFVAPIGPEDEEGRPTWEIL